MFARFVVAHRALSVHDCGNVHFNQRGTEAGGGRIESDCAVRCPRYLSNAIRCRICGYFDNFGGGFSKVGGVRRVARRF